jgi:hypothetical protein
MLVTECHLRSDPDGNIALRRNLFRVVMMLACVAS